MSISSPWDEQLDRIGLFGVHLFALFALFGTAVASVGLALFLLAFLLRFRGWRLLGRDPVAILCLLFALYLGLHMLVFYPIMPLGTAARDMVETGADWAKLTLLVPFAYWVGGDPNRTRRLLLLLLLGFTVGFLHKIDWDTFDATFFQTRFHNYLPASAFGMLAGLGTLGLITLRARFRGDSGSWFVCWTRMLLWGLLLAIAAEGLVLSHSRGAWLAFLIAALFLWLVPRESDRDAHAGRGGRIAAPLVFGTLLVLLVVAHWDRVQGRLYTGTLAVMQILDGNLDKVKPSPISSRLRVWRYGFEEWQQSPWFGLGASTSRHHIATSNRPALMTEDQQWLSHLHNTYLEILYQLGLVGLILLTALIWVLARGVVAEHRAGRIPRDLYRFLLATLIFVLVWNLFEYRAVRHDWRFFWIICAGIAYSFHLHTLLRGTQSHLQRSGQGPRP